MGLSYACATHIMAQLAAQGVTEVVLCPGSRSAPLALAAFEADRRGLLRLHVRTDERSAGFLALGLAKASRRPVAVATTSGTAVGNLLPAVMEAHHAEVPLVVLSADRPAALVGTGANQTTDQVGLFGGFCRSEARVTTAAPASSWGAQVAAACVRAVGGSAGAGPVHLNVELTEPLVPDGTERWPAVRALADRTGPSLRPVELPPGPRTLVVCGDASVERGAEAAAFAELARLPLVAEPSSNARWGATALACGRLLLDGELAREVQRVVVFGHPTLSRPVNRLLGRDDVELVVVSPSGAWADPGWRAALVAPGVTLAAGAGDWLDRWLEADAAASAHVARVLGDGWHGWAVAGSVWAAASGRPLVVGASQVIRDVDLAPASGEPPAVFANRGLAGIDGTVATAVGVALATGEPTTLVCGDLTFLHDANGLAIGPGEPRPDLRVVVVDDAGGAIFATLEYGQEAFADAFERVFATPTGVDVARLAAAYGVPVVEVASRSELDATLALPPAGVEVVVCRVGRDDRRGLTRALAAPRD